MHGLRARSPELVCSPGPCLNAGQPHVVSPLRVMSCLLCFKLTGKKEPGGGLAVDVGQGSPRAAGFLSDFLVTDLPLCVHSAVSKSSL